MTAARIAVIGIIMSALIAGIALWYLQVYAYYDRLEAEDVGEVQLTSVMTGQPEPIVFENLQAIDSDSSPIRFRACFQTPLSIGMLTETFVVAPQAIPLNGPGWFDCYDARQIGEALETGEAVAFLGVENIRYGIDRLVAIFPDGRGYVWHQINRCGEVVFDGNPVPDDCPEPPETR